VNIGEDTERTGGNCGRSDAAEMSGDRTGEAVCFLILVRGTGTGKTLADVGGLKC